MRRLATGGRRWETLYTVPGDDLYRVAAADDGRLLAAWSNERLIHVFSAAGKHQLSFPRPAPPSPDVSRFQLSSLLFSPSGRDALIFMTGTIQVTTGAFRGPSWVTVAYRAHLDQLAAGQGQVQQVFRVDHGYLLQAGPRGAVLALPRTPGQRCDHQGCSVSQIVAYEFAGEGDALRKILFTSAHGEVERVRVVRGSDEERVALALEVSAPRRSDVLQWRYGEAAARTRPLPWSTRDETTALLWTRGGELVAFRRLDNRLEISRERGGASEPIATLGSLQPVDLTIHGYGDRGGGRLWVHWGDHVGFVSPGQPARSHSLEALMPRRSDWGGDVFIRATDQLWVGIDSRGRDYARVNLAEAERRSRPWPAHDTTGVSGSGGEGDVTYKKDPSSADRLYGTALKPVPGGLVSLGGASLRRLTAGSARWEVLHQVPGDNLYRVAADGAGRLLATWENETVIHLFSPAEGRHVVIPKPVLTFTTRDGHPYNALRVESVEFAADGRDALVFTAGQEGASATFIHAAHLIALDGRSPPRQLFRVDRGVQIHSSRRGAVLAIPQTAQQECSHQTCWPIGAIVAYEISGERVTQRTLLDSSRADMSTATPVRGSDDERVGMVLNLVQRRGPQRLNGGRALLRWRWGEAGADYRPLPGNGELTPTWLLAANGDFVEALHRYDLTPEVLEIHRHPLTGAEEVTTLAALEHRPSPQGMGRRSGGGLWLQWGEHLALLAPGQPARSLNIERLMQRGWEWAGAHIYVPTPESLWVGLDGRGRQYVRIDLADADRRSQSWPERGPQGR